jgi:uncharacterized membrane protein
VTITAFWKVLADRTGRADLIAHAQGGVIVADWIFTLSGIVLILVGGYGMAWLGGYPLFTEPWLVSGQLLFAVSGAIWIGILVPLQIRQARAAKAFPSDGSIPVSYRRDARLWLFWGVLATVPLIAAVYVMVVK